MLNEIVSLATLALAVWVVIEVRSMSAKYDAVVEALSVEREVAGEVESVGITEEDDEHEVDWEQVNAELQPVLGPRHTPWSTQRKDIEYREWAEAVKGMNRNG